MSVRKTQVNVLVATSNDILNEGLRRVCEEVADYKVVCLQDRAPAFKPDVLVFDAQRNLPQLQQAYPEAKAILLDTGLEDQQIATFLVCQNVRGVISPRASVPMFHKAIRVVATGEVWLDQKHLKNLLRHNGVLSGRGDIRSLSRQDHRIVELIGRGLNNREIGAQLHLSEHTIKAHVSRIYRALNVRNRAQLTGLFRHLNEAEFFTE